MGPPLVLERLPFGLPTRVAGGPGRIIEGAGGDGAARPMRGNRAGRIRGRGKFRRSGGRAR